MKTKKGKQNLHKKDNKSDQEKAEFSMEEFMLLKQQNDENSTKLHEYEEIIKRQQAEFENYRRRTLKEKDNLYKYAGLEIFKDLLETIDNFDRALNVETSDESLKSFLKGFAMIDDELKNLLKKYKVKEIGGRGTEFNPNLHQAITFEEDDKVKAETVEEVFKKGYLLHDRVLRIATVKIKKPKNNLTPQEKKAAEEGAPQTGTEKGETKKEDKHTEKREPESSTDDRKNK